jgi:16S rRNA processing protein RimM
LRAFNADSPIHIRTADGRELLHIIESARPHKKIVLVSLKGISAVDSAERFIGSELFLEKESLPELEEGTYYWDDIIGLSVYTKENRFIGIVTSVISTGSNDVYAVKCPDENKDKEVLIPAIESVVLKIDLQNKKMSVELPEGLE